VAKAERRRVARTLHAMGVLTTIDRAALAAYCQAYARWVEAEEKLKESPTLYKTPSGYVQQSPWLGIANKQLELMGRYMTELGMTPAARSRVTPMQDPRLQLPMIEIGDVRPARDHHRGDRTAGPTGGAGTVSRRPACPAHLTAPAAREWRRVSRVLRDAGVLTAADTAALAAYCQAWGRWVEAEERLQEVQLLYRTPSGHVQQSPWLGIIHKQLELMGRYMVELGMTPASRSRVSVPLTSVPALNHRDLSDAELEAMIASFTQVGVPALANGASR
jgi:P27 family predicted phage terminase small subunit